MHRVDLEGHVIHPPLSLAVIRAKIKQWIIEEAVITYERREAKTAVGINLKMQ